MIVQMLRLVNSDDYALSPDSCYIKWIVSKITAVINASQLTYITSWQSSGICVEGGLRWLWLLSIAVWSTNKYYHHTDS